MAIRIHESSQSLSLALKRLVNDFVGDSRIILRKSAFDLDKNIKQRCPVDTGRARASIHASNAPSDWKPPEGQEQYDITEFPDDVNFDNSDTIYIQSNVEYIIDLENGSSKQAPRGMFALSMDIMRAHLNSELRKLKFK